MYKTAGQNTIIKTVLIGFIAQHEYINHLKYIVLRCISLVRRFRQALS